MATSLICSCNVALLIFLFFTSVDGLPNPIRSKRQIGGKEMLLRQICAIGDYTFRHPFSCTGYLICDKGMYTEQECPWAMVYDVKIKACNFKRKVKCQMNDGMSDYGDNPFDDTLTYSPTTPSPW